MTAGPEGSDAASLAFDALTRARADGVSEELIAALLGKAFRGMNLAGIADASSRHPFVVVTPTGADADRLAATACLVANASRAVADFVWEGLREEDFEFRRVILEKMREALGERVARPERGLMTRPSLNEVLAYRREIDRTMGLCGITTVGGIDASLLARRDD